MFNIPEPTRTNRSVLRVAATMAVAVVVFAGCTTVPVRTSGGIVVESDDEIAITARYYSAEELRDRFTQRDNPFIAPLMLFTPAEFLVFDMTIETADPRSIIDSAEIELSYDGEQYLAQTPRQLLRFWRGTAVYNDLSGLRLRRFEQLVNRELLTRPPAEKNGAAAGIVLFRTRRFPAEGRVSISVPVTSLTTGSTTRHRIAFRLAEVEQAE